MGHLPIVNLTSIEGLTRFGFIGTNGESEDRWVKTIADLFSDVLAMREGDLVFPWIIAGKNPKTPNVGFQYIFKIKGKPIYVPGDSHPIKVEVFDEYKKYEFPLSEPEAVELWTRKLLWNVIGKKSLGRGRSLNHQMPMEDTQMISLLESKNNNLPSINRVSERVEFAEHQIITIDTTQNQENEIFYNSIDLLPKEEKIKNLDISKIQWVKGNKFCVEKALEAWLMENIDNEKTQELKNLMGLEGYELIWFSNYLPYGVSGFNIDVVLMHSNGEEIIVTVMELKVDGASAKKFEIFSKQVTDYASYLERAFNSYGKTVVVNRVILAGHTAHRGTVASTDVKWITYSIDHNGVVTFFDKTPTP